MHRDRTADKATAKLRLKEMERVKRLLSRVGFTLRDVDREYGLPRGIAGRTLVEPNIKGERAIAAALKSRPHLLWGSRYHGDGTRKAPQPKENYQRPPTLSERRAMVENAREAA